MTDTAWEEAYLRFETPAQEVRKFERRLRALDADAWPRESEVLELCCGRGGGLVALERLGFARLAGVDRWHGGLRRYRGRARVAVADVRRLPFPDESKDVLIVQGGLHHLEDLEPDLERTLSEAHRVLRPGGRFVAVEPWGTPFLDAVVGLSGVPLLRRASRRVDAFATMVELEGETYRRWLACPEAILASVQRWLTVERMRVRLGKWMLVARRQAGPAGAVYGASG